MSNATQGLLVVSPGGPYEAMVECADAFSHSRDVTFEVIKGSSERWLDRRADLIYGGFPQMLTDLAGRGSSRGALYQRDPRAL